MLTERAWRPEAVILFIGLQIACIFMGAIAVGLLDHAGVAAFQLPDPHHSGAGATGFGAVVVGCMTPTGGIFSDCGIHTLGRHWDGPS